MYRENDLPAPHALHSADSIGLATFLGSPLAGAALMAINERRVGRASAAWKTLAVGVAITGGLLALSMALPSAPSGAFGGITMGLAYGARSTAKEWFRKATEEGRIGEVRYVSRWVAAGVALASIVVVLAVGVGAAVLTEHTIEHVELRPGANVYYDGVTEAEARRVGDLLRAEGFFAGTRQTDVKYERVANGHALSFVVSEAQATLETIREFQGVAARLQPSTDPGGTLTVRLCGPEWVAHHETRAP